MSFALNRPSPVLTGEEGPKPKAWEVRVFAEAGVQTLTSHRFAAGPSSPVKNGRGSRAPRPDCFLASRLAMTDDHA